MTTQVQPLHTLESKPNSISKHDKPLPYFKPFIAFQGRIQMFCNILYDLKLKKCYKTSIFFLITCITDLKVLYILLNPFSHKLCFLKHAFLHLAFRNRGFPKMHLQLNTTCYIYILYRKISSKNFKKPQQYNCRGLNLGNTFP